MTVRGKGSIFVIGSVLVGGLFFGAWRLYGDPGAKIRATIMTGAEAFQRKDCRRALQCVSPNYRDENGWTFRHIQRLLFEWCRDKHSQIWLTVRVADIFLLDFWQAVALVEVRGLLVPLGFSTLKFGPLSVTVKLERAWWGRWRITAVEGWQNDPNLRKLRSELMGE